MTKIATRREDMTEGARNFLNEFDEFLGDVLEIESDSELLTDEFRNNRSNYTSFEYIQEKLKEKEPAPVDPRSKSCKFNRDREIVECTDERLESLLVMSEQAENQEELEHEPDSDRLFKKQCEFMAQLIEWGTYRVVEV